MLWIEECMNSSSEFPRPVFITSGYSYGPGDESFVDHDLRALNAANRVALGAFALEEQGVRRRFASDVFDEVKHIIYTIEESEIIAENGALPPVQRTTVDVAQAICRVALASSELWTLRSCALYRLWKTRYDLLQKVRALLSGLSERDIIKNSLISYGLLQHRKIAWEVAA